MTIRPLYVSPIGRGGVDIGIQNILRAVKRAGLSDAELLRMPERYNFIPMLLQAAMPRQWWHGRSIIQARSRVAFALKRPGIPLVTTVHHLTTDPRLQPVSSRAQRVFYRLVESRYDGWSVAQADAVVCVSRYTQQMTEATYGRRDTHLIYDGIDTDVFTPTPHAQRLEALPASDARIRLLFVGNRTRRKGFDLLAKIMDLLPSDYVLYYTASFQTGVDVNPHPRMIPIGTPDRDGLVAAYRSADIMLFPSRLEGFGIAPAEALACGVPVVTT
ncbi:MAG: glycosyltransferase family 4 protein, partial [Roseiflexaceae bacterium]